MIAPQRQYRSRKGPEYLPRRATLQALGIVDRDRHEHRGPPAKPRQTESITNAVATDASTIGESTSDRASATKSSSRTSWKARKCVARLRLAKTCLGHERAGRPQCGFALCCAEQAEPVVACGFESDEIAEMFAELGVDPSQNFGCSLMVLP